MKKKILPVLFLLLLLGALTACTHKALGQKQLPPASQSGASSAVSPGDAAAASGIASSTTQNEDLQNILNNLNRIGDSADSLDRATSSDLAIPDN